MPEKYEGAHPPRALTLECVIRGSARVGNLLDWINVKPRAGMSRDEVTVKR